MKKVTVVLPTYNGAEFLRQSIDSVLGQTYKDIQLILVDDCSTDETPSIISYYARRDPRVHVIRNVENQKLPKSLNIGFSAAEGEYWTWTSDDNWYEPDAIMKMVRYLDENPDKGLVAADFKKYCGDSITASHIDVTPEHLLEGTIGACFLYRADIAKEVGPYNVECFLAEDFEYWLRMGLRTKFGKINEVLYNYRIHPNSLTGSRMQEIMAVNLKVKESMIERYKETYLNFDFTKTELEILWKRLLEDKDVAAVEKLRRCVGAGEIADRLKDRYKRTGDWFYTGTLARMGIFFYLKAKWLKFKYWKRFAEKKAENGHIAAMVVKEGQ